jgi:hypothetical protein
MSQHRTAVYVGAGLDLAPVLLFRTISRFIYIDSQPLTEFGSLPLCEEFKRPEFSDKLFHKMKNLGYKRRIVSPNPNLEIYLHPRRGTEVYYYKNNRFPNELDRDCLLDIKNASVLICCGHHPNEKIIDMMSGGPMLFIGDNKTYYNCDKGDESSLIRKIIETPALFEEYIRFDYPPLFDYYNDNMVEESCITTFKVTKYSSLQDMSKF